MKKAPQGYFTKFKRFCDICDWNKPCYKRIINDEKLWICHDCLKQISTVTTKDSINLEIYYFINVEDKKVLAKYPIE